MSSRPLYHVRVGQDLYVGTAAEVVAFMGRADGAPGHDTATFMEGVARRVKEQTGRELAATADPAAFLDSLAASGLAQVLRTQEPAEERVDPRDLFQGGEPIVYGPGSDPADVDPYLT